MTSPQTSNNRKWAFPVAVIVIAALLVAAILITQRTDDGAQSTTANQQTTPAELAPQQTTAADPTSPAELAELPEDELRDYLRGLVTFDPDYPMAIGDPGAKIGMIMFSDPQCPHCAEWVTNTLPELQHYIDDGQLRLEWHDAVVFGQDSERGARASYAAGKQGKFLEYTRILYADGEKASKKTLSEEGLRGVAKEIGLDLDKFDTDLHSEETQTAVTESVELSRLLGLVATPGFIIDGQPVMGAQPVEVFKQIIDDSLAHQG